MLLASDINDNVFSFLHAEELCNCFATCRLWHSSKGSKSTSVLIWFNLYRQLVECPKMLPHTDDFPWYQKFTELYSFVSGASPFTLLDARCESVVKVSKAQQGASQPIRLVCRSGHTASLFYVDGREVVVFFGGATHFYTFVNSYDILSVEDGVPLKTYATVNGDAPTARWLHRACSFEDHKKVIIFGGQINDGAFSNDVFLFSLIQSESNKSTQTADYKITLNLESVYVPPADGDNKNGPRPRGGHSFVYDEKGNRFIAFGGLTSMNEVEMCVNDTYQLTLQKEPLLTLNEAVTPGRLRWNCVKKRPDNGSGVKSQGGNISSGPVAVWKKLNTTGTHPSPRWCHSGMLQGDDMLVFGGWSYERSVGVGSGSKFFNDVHVLNIATLVWTQLDTSGSPPRPRCQCACFLFQNKIVKNSDISPVITVDTESSGKWEVQAMQTAADVHLLIGSNAIEGRKDTENVPKSESDLKSEIHVPKEVPTYENIMGQNNCPTEGVPNACDSAHNDVSLSLMQLKIAQCSGGSNPTVLPSLSLDEEKKKEKEKENGSHLLDSHMEDNQKVDSVTEIHGHVARTDIPTFNGSASLAVDHQVQNSPLHGRHSDSIVSASRTNLTHMDTDEMERMGKRTALISPINGESRDYPGPPLSPYLEDPTMPPRKTPPASSSTPPLEMICGKAENGSSSSGGRMERMANEKSEGREADSAPLKSSKGYMVIFGGSCHNQEVESANAAYGSLVVDFHDFKVLDLDTMVWLPVSCSYPRCRGGIHAVVETQRGWLLSGGMQTEGISDMPRFKNGTTFMLPNIGGEKSLTPTWRPSSKKPDASEDEDIRVRSKFLSVKA